MSSYRLPAHKTKKEVAQVTFELGLITSHCLESEFQIAAEVKYLAYWRDSCAFESVLFIRVTESDFSAL